MLLPLPLADGLVPEVPEAPLPDEPEPSVLEPEEPEPEEPEPSVLEPDDPEPIVLESELPEEPEPRVDPVCPELEPERPEEVVLEGQFVLLPERPELPCALFPRVLPELPEPLGAVTPPEELPDPIVADEPALPEPDEPALPDEPLPMAKLGTARAIAATDTVARRSFLMIAFPW